MQYPSQDRVWLGAAKRCRVFLNRKQRGQVCDPILGCKYEQLELDDHDLEIMSELEIAISSALQMLRNTVDE